MTAVVDEILIKAVAGLSIFWQNDEIETHFGEIIKSGTAPSDLIMCWPYYF